VIEDLFARLLVPADARQALRARLNGPGRFYHNQRHVETLWARHLRHGGAPDDAVTAHAIAYHDAIYVPGRSDNEALSAKLWMTESVRCPGALRNAVRTMILATADHRRYAGGDPLVLWMLDLDLSSLGDPPVAYALYTGALRREYAAVSEAAWRQGRATFLRDILAAPAIFRCPLRHWVLPRSYETLARHNITAELRQLQHA